MIKNSKFGNAYSTNVHVHEAILMNKIAILGNENFAKDVESIEVVFELFAVIREAVRVMWGLKRG